MCRVTQAIPARALPHCSSPLLWTKQCPGADGKEMRESWNHTAFTSSKNLTLMMLWEEKKWTWQQKLRQFFEALCQSIYLYVCKYIFDSYFGIESIWTTTLEILSHVLNSSIYNFKDVSTQNHSWHGTPHQTNRKLACLFFFFLNHFGRMVFLINRNLN